MDTIIEICTEKRIAHFDIKITDKVLATLWYGCYLELTPASPGTISTNHCFSLKDLEVFVEQYHAELKQLHRLNITVQIRMKNLCRDVIISETWRQQGDRMYLHFL